MVEQPRRLWSAKTLFTPGDHLDLQTEPSLTLEHG
jgi:hypothetical protein